MLSTMRTQIASNRPGLRGAVTGVICALAATINLWAQNSAPPVSGRTTEASPLGCATCHGKTKATPSWMAQLLVLRSNAVPGEAMDEPLGGKTLMGTPIFSRREECFPAETRDLFWQMDMVPDGVGTNTQLRPLNFDVKGDSNLDEDAIRGRNTWVLWSGGNEGFWNWLSQNGYGITDFLVLLDSRTRGSRFARAGLINQPGFASNSDKSRTVLGLYLDVPVDDSHTNSDLPGSYASHGHVLTGPDGVIQLKPQVELFEPGDTNCYATNMAILNKMGDGVDYSVYGYPSGVVGLRLYPNPDFFGTGAGPAKARGYWARQVQASPDNYYTNNLINQDPKLVRPFRVGMSCGFCHIAPHPLNPPKDPEAPDWANLSTTIGNQFWKPQPAFAVLENTNSFLHHFLASQQPGTIDTSLTSSDQINNANSINAIFDVNARLSRAMLNPSERQSTNNLLLRSIEDGPDGTNDWRHTPRVLVDGSDSIGVFGALARVYLNIGTFYEEWLRCDNLVIGFHQQRAFSIEVCRRNSVYWRANELFRAGYLSAFFTMAYNPATNRLPMQATNLACVTPHTSTQPMKLITAKDGDGKTPSKAVTEWLNTSSKAARQRGRLVWLNNCAICHSSKQPAGFALKFVRKRGGAPWNAEPAQMDATYTLPLNAADWVAYKTSPNYQDYIKRLYLLVGQGGTLDDDPLDDTHPFWKDNYLSTDIRVPLTLVGTPSGRALASNGIKGHMWDNFTSITYKELPAVGAVDYFNPITATAATFDAPGGGRGYYRPASLVSLWATAPYLHNNALGVYLDNPSVKGRLVAYFDGIRRVLWSETRTNRSLLLSGTERKWLSQVQKDESANDTYYVNANMDTRHPGDLRGLCDAAANDPGFIYRVPYDTEVQFAPGFIRPLVEGVAGPFVTALLTFWLWFVLGIVLVWLSWKGKPRYLGIVFIALALLVPLPLAVSSMGNGGSAMGVFMMGLATFLPFTIWGWRIVAFTLALAGIICIEAKPERPKGARSVVVTLLAGLAIALLISHVFWAGVVTLILGGLLGSAASWKLPDFARACFILLAVAAIVAGYGTHQFVDGQPLPTLTNAGVTMKALPIKVGPIPQGTPVNLLMNIDPESPRLSTALVATTVALAEIRRQGLTNDAAWRLFSQCAGQPLMDASKCPDFVLDRGHLFGETLDADPRQNEQDKEDLIAFLLTL